MGDHCRGIHAALRSGRAREVYNFGGHCELTNIDLTRQLLAALDKPESLIKYVIDRPGHDFRYAIDSTKAEQELGWAPQVDFTTGLQQTIDWYQSHPAWVQRVLSGEYRNWYQRQYGERISES